MAIEDLHDYPAGSSIVADVCIVGSGPAAVTVAHRLCDAGATICIAESGGLAPDAEAECLNEIENVGMRRAPQASTRARGLGGTSSLWTGRCGVLDPIDFAKRPWVEHSGWPIDHGDIAPYLGAAGELLGLGPSRYCGAEVNSVDPPRPNPWDPRLLQPLVFQSSVADPNQRQELRSVVGDGVAEAEHIGVLQHAGTPRPVHFGHALLHQLGQRDNVRILKHSTVVEIETDDEARTVTGVVISTLDGRRSSVQAPLVVIACGGVENARVLLASRTVNPSGIGNQHDLVGRFLMDHPFAPIAEYRSNGPREVRRRFGHRWLDVNGFRHVYSMGVRLSPELQRSEQLLNAQIHTVDQGDLRSGLRRAHGAFAAVRDEGLNRSTAADLLASFRRPDVLGRGLYERQILRQPSLIDADRVVFGCVVEQVPDPRSRVMLSERVDAVGMPLARLDWRASDEEVVTLRRMVEILVSEIERLGYEPPQLAPWLAEGAQGWRHTVHDMAHPLGTTRMATDPRLGVVDGDCAVHGIGGLFVAGSSVFSTSGYVYPTLTIVALALRLADHLKTRLLPTNSVLVTSPRSSEPKRIGRPTLVGTPMRVGIVGLGERVTDYHLPIMRSLPERFDVVGFSSRTDERRTRLATRTGLAGYSSPEELIADAKPELLLVAVSPDAIDHAVPQMLELGVPLLLETPLSWNVGVGRSLVQRIEASGLTVGIAEQTPFLPIEVVKRSAIELGLLGHVLLASNDFAIFDYHGLATLRRSFGAGRDPVYVSATSAPFGEGSVQLGTVTFSDGSVLIQNFGDSYGAPGFGRPASLRLIGTSGSFFNDSLTTLGPDGEALVTTVRRVESHGRLEELVLQAPGGEVRWRNPFATCDFGDEHIAVASLLVAMADAVRTGDDPPYRPADSLIDMEILSAMRYSAAGKGRPVDVPAGHFDRLRSVHHRAAARKLSERAPTLSHR